MHMRNIPAVEMIGQAVRCFGFFLFGHPVRGFVAIFISREGSRVNSAANPKARPDIMTAAAGFLKNRHVCLTACGAAQTLPAACLKLPMNCRQCAAPAAPARCN
jgi:hypothetical protein